MEACSNIMRKGNRNMRACWGERGLLEHKGDKSTGTSEDVSTQSGVGSSDLVFSTVFLGNIDDLHNMDIHISL
jgi:hypothetical protein